MPKVGTLVATRRWEEGGDSGRASHHGRQGFGFNALVQGLRFGLRVRV